MFTRELCLVYHELTPCGVDSVRYFGRSCVVEACGSSKVFGGVFIRQDLYVHVVNLGLCVFASPCSAHCVAEYFRFVGM